jgi:hypothetical protein
MCAGRVTLIGTFTLLGIGCLRPAASLVSVRGVIVTSDVGFYQPHTLDRQPERSPRCWAVFGTYGASEPCRLPRPHPPSPR